MSQRGPSIETSENYRASERNAVKPGSSHDAVLVTLKEPELPVMSLQVPDSVSEPRSLLLQFLVVFQLCSINFMASFSNGAITVGLPTMAASLHIPQKLYTWPSSVYGLSSGTTILLAGAIADVIGPWYIELLGSFILSAATLACGTARNPIQLIVFRAFQGTGMSMHLPASVALITKAIPPGKGRNLSFGCLGLSQPLGFSVGLVLSGIIIESVNWRLCFFIAGGICLMAAVAGLWSLPKDHATRVSSVPIRTRLQTEVDWIGCLLASAGLALLIYVLAVASSDPTQIRRPANVVMLCFSCTALLGFPFWMHHRQRNGKVSLIPNSLWTNRSFTCVCVMVALTYGALGSSELFSSLYFQNVQHTSTLYTSLRLLPGTVTGVIINLTISLLVDRVPIRWVVLVSSCVSCLSPMLMAIVDPEQSFWYMEFWAQSLAPCSVDVLFTVGLLVISQVFSEEQQALAGAVFNTVSQFGWSLGLALCQVVALNVSHEATGNDASESAEVLKGYRASFWTIFALLCSSVLLAATGLRKIGRIGLKRD